MRSIFLAVALLAVVPGNELEIASETLDHILFRYRATGSHPDVGVLVQLDGDLRRLIHDRWRREQRGFDGRIWKPVWSEIGVGVSHYGDDLTYSGKLLVEAHRMDRGGRFRKFTLFSEILGERNPSGLGEMPDLERAQEYVKEFPDGPFADETEIILGNFYDDLFKVLTELQANKELGYKYDCFSKYVRKGDLGPQAARAQRLSLGHYARALELLAGREPGWAETRYVEDWRTQVKEGRSVGWHFCAD